MDTNCISPRTNSLTLKLDFCLLKLSLVLELYVRLLTLSLGLKLYFRLLKLSFARLLNISGLCSLNLTQRDKCATKPANQKLEERKFLSTASFQIWNSQSEFTLFLSLIGWFYGLFVTSCLVEWNWDVERASERVCFSKLEILYTLRFCAWK